MVLHVGGRGPGHMARLPSKRGAFSRYPLLKAAYAAGRGKIGFIGDSKTMGWLAGAGVTHNGAYVLTPAATVISDLNAAGITAIDGYFGADKATGSIANWLLYDTRMSCSNTTNWSLAAQGSIDGLLATNATDTVPITLAPGFAYDRVQATYLRVAGNGTFTVKRGGSTIITADQNNATADLFTQTVNVSLASTALDVARSTGTTYPLPWVQVWNSAVQHVQVFQLGVGGRKTSDWLSNGSPWNPYPALAAMDCDCYFIELGANDAQAGVSSATYQANLQTLITYLKGNGADVQLVSTTRTGGGGAAYDISSAYLTALNDLTASNSLPPLIDLYTYSSPYSAGNYVDGIHRTATYNATVGHVLSSALTS